MAKSPKIELVLASASDRRLQLLAQIGITPEHVVATEIDEGLLPRERPRAYTQRLAREKALAAAGAAGGALVLAADTVVACGQRMLAKAGSAAEARGHLERLSGRRHQVFTALALIDADGRLRARTVLTRVTFKRLSANEIDCYIESDEWRGKAGSYAIQGLAGAFVRRLNGSYSNVVGLPLYETAGLLGAAGYLRSGPDCPA